MAAKLKASEDRMARLKTDLHNAQANKKRQGHTYPATVAKSMDSNAMTTHLSCFVDGVPLTAVIDTRASLNPSYRPH